MNTDLHTAADQWVGVVNNQIVCHTGIIQFPLRKGWKRVHRLVVLPDYQGIGIGTKFIKEVAKQYNKNGYEVNLTTTTPALVYGLKKSNSWSLVRMGRTKTSWRLSNKKHLENASSKKRVTFSFIFKG